MEVIACWFYVVYSSYISNELIIDNIYKYVKDAFDMRMIKYDKIKINGTIKFLSNLAFDAVLNYKSNIIYSINDVYYMYSLG